MSIFVIADLHLGHSVDKPMDIFGQQWYEHHERIAANWWERVGPEDTVLIAGDISWAMRLEEAKEDLYFIQGLPGKKILLRGNHDYWWSSLRKLRDFAATESLDSLQFLHNNAYIIDDHYVLAGTRLWMQPDDSRYQAADDKILQREFNRLKLSLEAAQALRGSRKLLVIFHYPPFDKQLQSNEITRLLQELEVHHVFFGHIHNKDSPYCFQEKIIDGVPYSLVSVDYLDFIPYRLS